MESVLWRRPTCSAGAFGVKEPRDWLLQRALCGPAAAVCASTTWGLLAVLLAMFPRLNEHKEGNAATVFVGGLLIVLGFVLRRLPTCSAGVFVVKELGAASTEGPVLEARGSARRERERKPGDDLAACTR